MKRMAGRVSSLASKRIARQRGSVTIMAAIFVVTAIVLGIAIDGGYLFYMKRNLQKVADMAASAGAQSLPVCANVPASVQTNAQANVSAAEYAKLTFGQVDCGLWTLAQNGTGSYTPNASLGASDTPNAVKVTVSESVPSFFSQAGSRTVQATAIAQKTQTPMAAFSIGSGLASIDPAALNGLLSAMLGTSVNLSAATYQGLANANVSLLDLVRLVLLSAGSTAQVLDTQITVASLIAATLGALSPQQIASLNIASTDTDALLQAVQISTVGAEQIALGDILNLSASDLQSALDASVNAGELIMLAVQDGSKQGAGLINLGTLIDLAPLATVSLKASIIEPPQMAIGEAGQDASGNWKTVAHTAQVRLLLDLQGFQMPASATNLLSLSLPGIASVSVSLPAGALLDLPLYAELAPGQAWLTDVSCGGPASGRTATIGANSGIANLFLGNMPTAFTNLSTLWANLTRQQINLAALAVNVSVLLAPIVQGQADLLTELDTQLDGASGQHVFNVQDIGTTAATWQIGTEQQLGAYLSNLLFGGSVASTTQLSTNLSLLGLPLSVLNAVTSALASNLGTLVSGVLQLLEPIVQPVLSALDTNLLSSLLRTLGVQIGYADVRLLWTNCSTANTVQVVY